MFTANTTHAVANERPVVRITCALLGLTLPMEMPERFSRQAAPVLHHGRHVFQIERAHEGDQAVAMEIERVDRVLGRFVGCRSPIERAKRLALRRLCRSARE
jgi:hypothetical protein